MIIYVDLEHERLKAEPGLWEKSLTRRLNHKYRLEELSGDMCLIVRYDRLNPALLREFAPPVRAVIISGCYTDFEHYSPESLAGLRAVYREAAWPTLGFCGGCQLLAQTYGAEIGPLGPLPGGVVNPAAIFDPTMKEERGFMPVAIHTPHLLLEGLGQRPIFFQSHYWEVKAPPPGFQVLAESNLCQIQALVHTERPLFGVQFHPEEYDDAHPDGRKLLENFFRIVGGYTILTPAISGASQMQEEKDRPDLAMPVDFV